MISTPGQMPGYGQARVPHPAACRGGEMNVQESFRQLRRSRCLLGAEDQPVAEGSWVAYILNIRKGAEVSVDSSPGTGAGYRSPSHSLLKHFPGAGLTLGRRQGHRISQVFEELTAARGVCCQLSDASKIQVCVPPLPVPLMLNKLLNLSDTCFPHL